MASGSARRFINRELSWLEFNQRILEQAQDESVPLLERLKFLTIVSSNLDEFFMVRVGGLQTLAARRSHKADPAGMTPQQQLTAIAERTARMAADQYACYTEHIEPALEEAGIQRKRAAELSLQQRDHVRVIFEQELYPLLSPFAVPSSADMPLLLNRALHLCVRLKPAEHSKKPRYAVVPIPKRLSRLVTLPSEGGYQFMLVEDLVYTMLPHLFPGLSIAECVPFRITRNADMAVREDLAGDLLAEMTEVLEERKRSGCVRLEIDQSASAGLLSFLQKSLRVPKNTIYRVNGPIDFTGISQLSDLRGHRQLHYEPWSPEQSPEIARDKKIFDTLSVNSLLLFHPYESFDPVLRLLDEAADDPDVIAIKQILYRTSRNSPIIAALIRAAEKGKYVTALVELKARFDEARNIEWAQELQEAGVQVVYGVKGLKTHAKLLMVIRREPEGLKRYTHFGTGNYNEVTARLYSDISYLTNDTDLATDATMFFNAITGYSQPQRFRKIDMAPLTLRKSIIELINNEIERKKQGQKAYIRAKMNSLADPEIIKALYAASKAGVPVQLNIRGICCLRPGVEGQSDHITVVSIVDRLLEHARILQFCNGGKDQVYISTADWMPRNLDRRVELLVPVEDTQGKKKLQSILETCFKDTTNSWMLLQDGSYERRNAGRRKKGFRAQEAFHAEALKRTRQAAALQRTKFEVHRPQG